MKNTYQLPCNIAQTLNIIGDKWTLLVLHEIMEGHQTYKEMQEHLEGIPSNLLSERLKTLEADGIISSTLYQNHPPRYQYLLSESGRDLIDIFFSLILWGEKHLKVCYKQLSHTECGCKIEHQYYCPNCGKPVRPEEICVKPPKESLKPEANEKHV